MKHSPREVKDTLFRLIREIAEDAPLYARNPERDFTRTRKLPMETVLKILLGMGNASLPDELLAHFGCTPDAASAPAFIQQRAKLLPEAVETLFRGFTEAFSGDRTERGYRLLAMDGSDVRIPTNPADEDTYFPGSNGQKPFNLKKLGALYDLLNRTYVDALVKGKVVANENKLLVEMVKRSNIREPVILMADRNFECWDTMAQLQNKGWNYVIRIKGNKGIASGLDLPDSEEYDLPIHLALTRKQSKEIKELLKDRNHYRYIPTSVRFDLLDSDAQFYHLSFRIVRFKLDNGTLETLVTNLDPVNFPPPELKRLYAMRWGIETSFRELKYTIGLRYFHGKKADFIRQEIFARLIMYNFSERITARAAIKKDGCKHTYLANFTRAVHICKELFRGRADPDFVEDVIARYLSPVRPGRKNPRNLRQQEAVYFIYRAA